MSTFETDPSSHSGVPVRPSRGIFLVTAGAIFVWLVSSFMKPLLIGAIFAIVLYPLMHFPRKPRIGPTWRALLITLLFTVSFLIPLGILLVAGSDAALGRLQQTFGGGAAPEAINLSAGGVIEMLGIQPWLDRISRLTPLDQEQLLMVINRAVQVVGSFAVNLLQSTLAGIPGLIASTFIVLVSLFFLLLDGARAVRFLRQNPIFSVMEMDRIIGVVRNLCRSVILASIVTGFIQGTAMAIACLITGVGQPALVALLTFVGSFLPVVGTAPVTVGLALYGFATGNYTAGIIFLVFVVIVGTIDNFVRPYVLKGGGELHPLVGFVSAFGALEVLGFYGLFIGPIVAGFFFTVLPMILRGHPERSESVETQR